MKLTLKEFLFSKKYGSLHYKLSYFFKHKLPFSKGWNEYHNPYFPWWKARKCFKKPHWVIAHKGKITWFYGLPIRKNYYNRIFDIRFSSLGWKSKFDSPRHEWEPYIAITLFRKWQIVWFFTYMRKEDKERYTRSMATWEAMLDYLYFNVPKDKLSARHTWGGHSGKQEDLILIDENLK